ncbi:major capsid protein [Magnetospirillum molischianum]|uniref:Phage major capsid protein n=1 Tax=Magnetospirillum molischianum DSM 120 TaxID=1150626 RepID=H8FY46_MAGML|nr:hypothetical protein [Magnetospirillum molischianum]CCG43284.1 conserved hypothetical protein [Magnetospirillum molischianum DSM 120]
MPLLRTTAELLSQEQMERGIIEEIIDKDDLFAVLPFKQVVGKAYVYDRELTLSEGDFIDVNDDVPEGAATFEEVVCRLARLAGDVDVDKFLDETMSDINDQKATQIASKAKALGRKFKRTLATGDRSVNSKAFDGIAKLVAAGQTISAGTNGNALSFSMLDELLDAVPYGADAIIMRSGTVRAYRALLRATGATGPTEVMIENFGRPMLCHNGVPIIVNDFLPLNEVQGSSSTTCSIYAARFNEADGLHGIYGGSSAGIRIEDIGTVQTKDASRTRLKWYAALALKSTKSLARIKGVTNSGGQDQSGTGKPTLV